MLGMQVCIILYCIVVCDGVRERKISCSIYIYEIQHRKTRVSLRVLLYSANNHEERKKCLRSTSAVFVYIIIDET